MRHVPVLFFSFRIFPDSSVVGRCRLPSHPSSAVWTVVEWGKLFIARAGGSEAVAEAPQRALFIFPGELRPGFGPFGVPGCRVLWPPAALEEGGGG